MREQLKNWKIVINQREKTFDSKLGFQFYSQVFNAWSACPDLLPDVSGFWARFGPDVDQMLTRF